MPVPFKLLLLGSLLSCVTARAQEVSDADKPRVKAAIIIAAYDELATKCQTQGGFNAAQKSEADRWTQENGVTALRKHLDGPGLSATLREQSRAAGSQVVRQAASKADPCVAAVTLTRTAEAKFAAKLPEMLANAGAAAAPATASAPASAPAPKPQPAPSSANLSKVAADIEGFGFDTCTRIGYGGMVTVAACPVVLFRNGQALTKVEALSHAQGLASHKAEFPKYWTQWRRSGGKVQLNKDGWENLGFNAVYSTLPADFRLDGRFRSVGGGGNTALGGGQAVIAWSDYVFTPDGRVRRDGGAGASSTGSGVDVTVGSNAAGKSGRYRVEGLILAMDFDDGSRERRVLIADPKDGGKGTMWLDGEGYTRKQ